jgi:hypothetical protein
MRRLGRLLCMALLMTGCHEVEGLYRVAKDGARIPEACVVSALETLTPGRHVPAEEPGQWRVRDDSLGVHSMDLVVEVDRKRGLEVFVNHWVQTHGRFTQQQGERAAVETRRLLDGILSRCVVPQETLQPDSCRMRMLQVKGIEGCPG